MQQRSQARKEIADQIADRARIDANAADALKRWLMELMQRRGTKKLETLRFRLSVCGNGGKQPIDITGEVPEDFMYTPDPEVDNEHVRKALESGEQLPFAQLLPRGTHLRIK